MHIILDLDETCINSVDAGKPIQNGFEFFEMFNAFGKLEMIVYKRPGLDAFLKNIFEKHCVSFWSAGEKTYVLEIVKKLVPCGKRPLFVLWRDHCEQCEQETRHLKNLDWLRRQLPSTSQQKLLLVDDLPENCSVNKTCAYKIAEFIAIPESQNDLALNKLEQFLIENGS